jgi:hypothetical protein
MASGVPPNQTIYINNLYEKLKKEGQLPQPFSGPIGPGFSHRY